MLDIEQRRAGGEVQDVGLARAPDRVGASTAVNDLDVDQIAQSAGDVDAVATGAAQHRVGARTTVEGVGAVVGAPDTEGVVAVAA